jgi:hypothetical protein
MRRPGVRCAVDIVQQGRIFLSEENVKPVFPDTPGKEKIFSNPEGRFFLYLFSPLLTNPVIRFIMVFGIKPAACCFPVTDRFLF